MITNFSSSLDIVDIAFESDSVQLKYLEATSNSAVITCRPYSGLMQVSHSSFYGCDSNTRTCEELASNGNVITTSLGSSVASEANSIVFSNTFCLAFHCFFNTLSELECSSEKQLVFKANSSQEDLLPIILIIGIISLILIAILSFMIGHSVANKRHTSKTRKRSNYTKELTSKSAHDNLAYDGTMTGVLPGTGQTTLTSRIFERETKTQTDGEYLDPPNLDMTQSGTNLHRGEGSSVSDVVLKLKMDSATNPNLYYLGEGVPSTVYTDASLRTWSIARDPSCNKCDSWVQTTSMFDTVNSGTLTSYGTVIIHDSCSTNMNGGSATQSEGVYATMTSQDETTWNSLVPSDRSNTQIPEHQHRAGPTYNMHFI